MTSAEGFSPSTQQSTASLTWNVFFGKGIENIFSGQAQFIQDCTVGLLCYALAPAQVAEHRWSSTLLHAETGIWQKHQHSHSILSKLQVFSGFGFLKFYLSFLIANTMQVSCKTNRHVLNDYRHPAVQPNHVKELCCCSNISRKEITESQT